ncbi:hypothetical protein Aduo_013538 [Ancylostoma duodenale]
MNNIWLFLNVACVLFASIKASGAWKKIGNTGFEYRAVRTIFGKTFDSAESTCSRLGGGHLASIQSDEENNFVYRKLFV